jgi:hypothetical protein
MPQIVVRASLLANCRAIAISNLQLYTFHILQIAEGRFVCSQQSGWACNSATKSTIEHLGTRRALVPAADGLRTKERLTFAVTSWKIRSAL